MAAMTYWNDTEYNHVLHKELLSLSQIMSHSNFLSRSQKHFKFDQNYKENYKDL